MKKRQQQIKATSKNLWDLSVFLGLLFCFFSGTTGFAQEIFPGDGNQEAVQAALDHVEEIRAQRNSERKKEKAGEETDFTDEQKEAEKVIDKIQVEKMSLEDVFAFIAQKSDLNFEIEEGLTGEVSLYLHKVRVEDLLNLLSGRQGLAYRQEGNTVKVTSLETYQEKYQDVFAYPLAVQVIPLAHVDYADILVELEGMKGKQTEIIYDELSGSLFIKGNQRTLDRIKKYIEIVDVFVETEIFDIDEGHFEEIVGKIQGMLSDKVGIMSIEKDAHRVIVTDIPSKLALIKDLVREGGKNLKFSYAVKALQIILYDEYEEGIDWDAIVSDYRKLSCQKPEASQEERRQQELSLGTLTQEDLAILLEALETVGEVHVISEVERITEDRRIEFKADFEKAVVEAKGDLNTAKEKTASLNVAIAFVKQEDSSLSLLLGSSVLGGKEKEKDRAFSDEKTSVSESIKIKDGSAIIVGSLISDVLVESTWKIPLLGDLPFLGFAFRNQGKRLRKSEIVVFISLQTLKE